MGLPRATIGGLMGLILACAAFAAVVRTGSEVLAGVCASAVLALLGISALGMIYRRGSRRAFCVGFALFGGGYAAVASGPWTTAAMRRSLVTEFVLAALRPWPSDVIWFEPPGLGVVRDASGRLIRPMTAVPAPGAAGWTFFSPNSTAVAGAGQAGSEAIMRAGHALFALVAAVLGGGIARWFHATRDRGRGEG